jgi:hypothetical protein
MLPRYRIPVGAVTLGQLILARSDYCHTPSSQSKCNQDCGDNKKVGYPVIDSGAPPIASGHLRDLASAQVQSNQTIKGVFGIAWHSR